MRIIIKLLLKLLFRVKVSGLEGLKFNGPTILMPNHISFMDAIILYAYLPDNVCFVVNTGIAKKLHFVLRWFNHVTVDPLNPYSLKRVVSIIKSGRPVVIFPEGRITTTGNFMKVYSGVGFITLKSGATIYPTILLGPELSTVSRIKDKVKSRLFPKITVHIDSPVDLTDLRAQSFRQQKRQISDRLLNILQNSKFRALQQKEMCSNLFDKLLEASKTHGANKIAIEDLNSAITYKKALISSYIFGDKLRSILGKEKTVGVMLPNSIGHFITLFALFYTGKTPAILNFTAGISNNLGCSALAGIKTILTSRTFVEKGKLENLVHQLGSSFRIVYLEDIKSTIGLVDKIKGALKRLFNRKAPADQTARLILFTSGSESKPKGVVLKHTNLLANIHQIACVYDFTHRDKMLNALPMFHSFGLTAGTLLPVLTGFEVFLYPTPLHYKIIPELAYDKNVTILLGTPTFLAGYARHAHPYDFYSIRYVLAGGEKLKEDVKEAWLHKFGIRIFEGYGTTETAPVLSVNSPLFNRGGSVGKLLPGIQWKTESVEGISNGGQLLVQGPNIMEGYLISEKGFVPAPQWYSTGDVVSLDTDGFIAIKSRLKRFAKVSGEMVSLDAIESTASKCFGTEENAVITLPDSRKGEAIILFTTNKDASRSALREYFASTGQSMLSLPAEVIVVNQLPLLGSGKTDYVTLRSNYENEVNSHVANL